MEHINSEEVRALRTEVTRALRLWEADSNNPAQVRRLQATAEHAQRQLAHWDRVGYPTFEIKQIADLVAHAEARLSLAEQEATRGY
jgi:hypothetical protein